MRRFTRVSRAATGFVVFTLALTLLGAWWGGSYSRSGSSSVKSPDRFVGRETESVLLDVLIVRYDADAALSGGPGVASALEASRPRGERRRPRALNSEEFDAVVRAAAALATTGEGEVLLAASLPAQADSRASIALEHDAVGSLTLAASPRVFKGGVVAVGLEIDVDSAGAPTAPGSPGAAAEPAAARWSARIPLTLADGTGVVTRLPAALAPAAGSPLGLLASTGAAAPDERAVLLALRATVITE